MGVCFSKSLISLLLSNEFNYLNQAIEYYLLIRPKNSDRQFSYKWLIISIRLMQGYQKVTLIIRWANSPNAISAEAGIPESSKAHNYWVELDSDQARNDEIHGTLFNGSKSSHGVRYPFRSGVVEPVGRYACSHGC
jgi:hypothetical protein